MDMSLVILFLHLCVGCAYCELLRPAFVSQDGQTIVTEYHGIIVENETLVRLTPSLRVRLPEEEASVTEKANSLCAVTLQHPNPAALPFEVDLNGEIRMVLRDGFSVDYDQHASYKFQMVATDCQNRRSKPVFVHVLVEPPNRPGYTFGEFSVTIAGGTQPNTVIGQLANLFTNAFQATSVDSNTVCDYQLVGSDSQSPFSVDSSGNLLVSQPVANERRLYSMSMRAVSCLPDITNRTVAHRGTWSLPVIVRVQVIPRCTPILSGVPQRLSGVRGPEVAPFTNASLTFCASNEPSQCFAEACARNYSLKVRILPEQHAQESCDLAKQRFAPVASCTKNELFEFLDSPMEFDDSRFIALSQSQTQSVVAMTQQVPFAVTWWMQRPQAAKGQLLCVTDQLNNYHLSVAFRECKLVATVHIGTNESRDDVIAPSEWQFNAPETCDSRWHHFALVMRRSEVQLLVDNVAVSDVQVQTVQEAPWSNESHRLTIGACFQGLTGRNAQYLNAKLAALAIVNVKGHADETLRCLSCSSRLDLLASADRVADLLSGLRNVRLAVQAAGDHVIELTLSHTRDDSVGQCLIDDAPAVARLLVGVVTPSTVTPNAATPAVQLRPVQDAPRHAAQSRERRHSGENVWLLPVAVAMVASVVCVTMFVTRARKRSNGALPPNTTCVDVDSLEIHLDNRLNEHDVEGECERVRPPRTETFGAFNAFARRLMARLRAARSVQVAGESELEWDTSDSQLHIVDNPFAFDSEQNDELVQSRIRLVNENLAFGNALLSNSLLRDVDSQAERLLLLTEKADLANLNVNVHAAVSEKHLNVEAFESIDSTSESEVETVREKETENRRAKSSNYVSESQSCHERLSSSRSGVGTAGRLVCSQSTSSFCAKSTMLLRNVADSARQSRMKSREQRFLDTSSSSSSDDDDQSVESNAGGYHYDTSSGSYSKVRVGSQPDVGSSV